MTPCTAVIVAYQSDDVLDACIDACRTHVAEVIVVDNTPGGASRPITRRPDVRWIVNETNRGFAGAVNQGVAAALHEAVLILNPDARVVAGVDELVRTLKLPDVGAATGRLVHAGGYQEGFSIRRLPSASTLCFELLGVNRLFPGNAINRRYRCAGFDPLRQADVEQPAGAFLMLNRDVWTQIGGWDERFYPVWFEDVDYCKRVREAGFRIVYTPDAVAEHVGGHSARQLSWRRRETYWYGSLLKYAGKHFSRVALIAISLCVVGGSLPRAVREAVRTTSLQPMRVCAQVTGLAVRYLLFFDGGKGAERAGNRIIHQA